VPVFLSWIYGNKKHPNLEIRVFTYQKLVCEEFLIFITYEKNGTNISNINY